MPDRGSRWLAALAAGALLAAPPVALAEAAASGTAPGGAAAWEADDGRDQISRRLVQIGRTPGEAKEAARRLTAEDLAVLLANPEMMQGAGGAQTEMAIGALLILGLIIALAAAGSATVIVSL